MLLVNVHELQVVLADAVVLAALKDQVKHVGGVLGLERENIFVLGSAEHLGERGQVDTEGDVAVASVRRKAFGLEHHGHKGNVGVVHGLEGDTRVIAVEVAVLDEILDGVDHLSAQELVSQLFIQSVRLSIIDDLECCTQRQMVAISYLLEDIGLLESSLQHF